MNDLKIYYWYYLSLHSKKWTRRFHFFGVMFTVAYLIWCIIESHWALSLLTPFIVYPFAWTGHFLFEKNKPAAFRDPIKAKICDFIMFWDILRRKIDW